MRSRSSLPMGLMAVLVVLTSCRGDVRSSAERGATTSPTSASAPTLAPSASSTTPPTVPNGRKVTWENVTLTVPADWKTNLSPGNFAAGPRIYDFRGYSLARLNGISGFDGSIDDLKPAACLRTDNTSNPLVPTAVTLVETGFAPVGDRTAQFRRWTATCPAGMEEHRAWVLPISRIALYEMCHDGNTVTVAQSAMVVDSATPQRTFGHPYPNELRSSCRDDLIDSATGT